jgi:diguanylate cyclase (GGDEF)-like protein
MDERRTDWLTLLAALDIQAGLVDGDGRLLGTTAAWDHATAHGAGEPTDLDRAERDLLASLAVRGGAGTIEPARRALQQIASGRFERIEVEFEGLATDDEDADDGEEADASTARARGGRPWYCLRLARMDDAPDGPDGRGRVRIAAEIRDISRTKAVQTALRNRERRLKLTNVLLRELSERDALTSLWNRRGLERALQREHRQSRRTGAPLSALLIDCDDFKRVNDRFGHTAGDRLLRRLGKLLRQTLRPRDLAARVGGDEFLVLLPATDIHQAQVIAERLRVRIAAELAEEAEFVAARTTVSLGVAEVAPTTVALDEVIHATQDALKKAKGSGKNRVSGPSSPAADDAPPNDASSDTPGR